MRFGGIGLSNPLLSADLEYSASTSITGNLPDVMYSQDKDLTNCNRVPSNWSMHKKNRYCKTNTINEEEVDVRTKRSMVPA